MPLLTGSLQLADLPPASRTGSFRAAGATLHAACLADLTCRAVHQLAASGLAADAAAELQPSATHPRQCVPPEGQLQHGRQHLVERGLRLLSSVLASSLASVPYGEPLPSSIQLLRCWHVRLCTKYWRYAARCVPGGHLVTHLVMLLGHRVHATPSKGGLPTLRIRPGVSADRCAAAADVQQHRLLTSFHLWSVARLTAALRPAHACDCTPALLLRLTQARSPSPQFACTLGSRHPSGFRVWGICQCDRCSV